ncbi:hypothetical protein D3C73_843570 [compost metagenome]
MAEGRVQTLKIVHPIAFRGSTMQGQAAGLVLVGHQGQQRRELGAMAQSSMQFAVKAGQRVERLKPHGRDKQQHLAHIGCRRNGTNRRGSVLGIPLHLRVLRVPCGQDERPMQRDMGSLIVLEGQPIHTRTITF